MQVTLGQSAAQEFGAAPLVNEWQLGAISLTVLGAVAALWCWQRSRKALTERDVPEAMPPARYFLLYVRDGEVHTADGTTLMGPRDFPAWLRCGKTEYCRLRDEETFFFWDDLVNADGATVGYVFCDPPSATFNASRFVTESRNVTVDEHGCIWLALLPTLPVEVRCLQEFSSEIYCSQRDPRDCVLLIYDWPENQIAFKLDPAEDWTSSHRTPPLREAL